MNIVFISALALFSNIPLGIWRCKYKKLSFPWFVLIHASVPPIIFLRIWMNTPSVFIPLFIALAVFGQYLGGKYGKKNELCKKKPE
jgi:hypothetical protein